MARFIACYGYRLFRLKLLRSVADARLVLCRCLVCGIVYPAPFRHKLICSSRAPHLVGFRNAFDSDIKSDPEGHLLQHSDLMMPGLAVCSVLVFLLQRLAHDFRMDFAVCQSLAWSIPLLECSNLGLGKAHSMKSFYKYISSSLRNHHIES